MTFKNVLSVLGLWNGGTPVTVDNTNRVPVVLNNSLQSVANSTTTPLNAGNTFTGIAEVNDYPSVLVSCATDQDGELDIQFSNNGGINWDSIVTKKLTAGTNEFTVLSKGYRHARIIVRNTSASNQTYLRLSTSYGFFQTKTSGLNAVVQNDEDAIVVKNVDYEQLVAEGKYQGRSITNKSGINPSISSGSVPEDVCYTGGIYAGFPTGSAETLAVSSSSASDTSAGVGARTIRISGLDGNYNQISENVTLNGTSTVLTTNQFLRVTQVGVQTAGSNSINVGDITVNHSVTVANVFAIVAAGIGRASLSNYTVPVGYKAYVRYLWANVLSSSSAHLQGYFWRRQFGGAAALTNEFAVSDQIPFSRHVYGGLVLQPKEDVVMRITTCSAPNVRVGAGFDLILVKDE